MEGQQIVDLVKKYLSDSQSFLAGYRDRLAAVDIGLSDTKTQMRLLVQATEANTNRLEKVLVALEKILDRKKARKKSETP